MTQAYKKKLIEVAIPLEAINAASAREKSIRHGHPSTLHLWWARRPLAACRAVLFAQLVDDPSSHPDKFPTEEAVEAERKRLFQIIEDLVKWENSTNEEVLERARAEIRKSCDGELPPVYDPFSGGGSIPLEAQRLGLPAYGSDLNPVAVVIGKAMIEIPPKFKNMEPIHPGGKERNHYRNAEGLAEDVKYYGEWMREKAWERIGHLYPKVDLPSKYGGGKAIVIAWIWTRTVPSPDPAFSDVDVPIASTFLLSSNKSKEAWIDPIVDRAAKSISYRVRNGGTKEELSRAKAGMKAGRGANFRCIISGTAITPDYVKSKGKNGELRQSLMAIVAERDGKRFFLSPTVEQESTALEADPSWKPETPLPGDLRAFWTPLYGLNTFGDLFTDRQAAALSTFVELIKDVRAEVLSVASRDQRLSDMKSLSEGGRGAQAYSEAVSIYLAFAIDKGTDYWSSVVTWMPRGTVGHLFARHAVPMAWDFPEANPLADTFHCSFVKAVDWVSKAVAVLPAQAEGSIVQMNASDAELDNSVVSTDPPYYDNIGYADLSDFFFSWLRPALKDVYPDLFSFLAVPKSEELVAVPYRHNSKTDAEQFFLNGMRSVMVNLAASSADNYPAAIYYAFKQSEIAEGGISSTGWSTFLQAIVEAGFEVHGTWPVRTERSARSIAIGTNALASSVVLVCRKKDPAADVVTRAEFLRALKRELPAAIRDLQAANVSPADMPQSAIGPGMGVFSRYKAVLEADDSPMTVKTALQLINAELDEFLNDLHGEFDADTRFAATWFEQHGNEKGDYGSADNLARARGISVESVKHAGIVDSSAGKVRIVKRSELDPDWDPLEDDHLTIWECCQHLIRVLENQGEYSAAVLLKKIGSDKAEMVKDLAYYLYEACSTKRQDAKEATSYNGLIAVWTELTRQAATVRIEDQNRQTAMDI